MLRLAAAGEQKKRGNARRASWGGRQYRGRTAAWTAWSGRGGDAVYGWDAWAVQCRREQWSAVERSWNAVQWRRRSGSSTAKTHRCTSSEWTSGRAMAAVGRRDAERRAYICTCRLLARLWASLAARPACSACGCVAQGQVPEPSALPPQCGPGLLLEAASVPGQGGLRGHPQEDERWGKVAGLTPRKRVRRGRNVTH
jgi:hypothetical protein